MFRDPDRKRLSAASPTLGNSFLKAGVQVHLEKEGGMKEMERNLTQDEVYHKLHLTSNDDNIMEFVKGKRKLR